jgi:DNA-binding transcriptional ArsR family regulator
VRWAEDRSRLKILYTLSHDQELCACDIATLLNAKVATASHYLCKLRDLKILKYRNDGKLAYYSLQARRASEILNSLAEIDRGSGFSESVRSATAKRSGARQP